MNAEDTKNHHMKLPRQSEAKLKQAPQSEANVCRRRRTKMQSQIKHPLLIAQVTQNAQNTQHKLGVAFEVRERNNNNRPLQKKAPQKGPLKNISPGAYFRNFTVFYRNGDCYHTGILIFLF